jgi:hypothetical protein
LKQHGKTSTTSATDDSWDDLDIHNDKPAVKSQQNSGNSWNQSKPVQKNNDDDSWDNLDVNNDKPAVKTQQNSGNNRNSGGSYG